MRTTLLRWAIVLVLVAAGLAFVVRGADSPADPTLGPAPAEGQARVTRTPFGDFGEIAFRVQGVTGEDAAARAAALRCALLADTTARQEVGLMNRTDLGGYDGMVFRFPADTSVAFYMKDTPLPLSIAFFDAGGQFVSAAEMAPCIHQSSCPTYGAARPYRFALEAAQGAMPRLGVGPGTRLVTTGPCP